jgi:excisionase family DNA binding protein
MLGSATAPVRPGARAGAPVHVAFRSMHSVGVPGVVLSRLNGQPVRAPVNASPAPSRVPPHDSGTVWFATPSLAETCTPILHAGLPAHALSHQRVLLRYTDSSARVVVNNINDVADPDFPAKEPLLGRCDNAQQRTTRLYTVDELSALFGVVPKTILRWIERGDLIVHRFNGRIRVSETNLQTFIRLHRQG